MKRVFLSVIALVAAVTVMAQTPYWKEAEDSRRFAPRLSYSEDAVCLQASALPATPDLRVSSWEPSAPPWAL